MAAPVGLAVVACWLCACGQAAEEPASKQAAAPTARVSAAPRAGDGERDEATSPPRPGTPDPTVTGATPPPESAEEKEASPIEIHRADPLAGPAAAGSATPSDKGGSGSLGRGGGKTSVKGATATSDEGTLTDEQIRTTISARLGELRACVKKTSRVTIDVRVQPSGEVGDAAATALTPDDPTSRDCVLDRVRKMKFPQPAGSRPAKLSLTINLAKDGAG